MSALNCPRLWQRDPRLPQVHPQEKRRPEPSRSERSEETDQDRRAAQSVLSLGGSVIVQVRRQAKSIEVKSGAALPAADFDVTEINLNARPAD